MAGTSPLRDKLAIVDSGSGIVGFADWAEQLIAETTGKQRHRHPARRRRQTPTTPRCAGPPPTSPWPGSSATPTTSRLGRHRRADGDPPRSEVARQRRARRPDAAVGGRDRRRRPAARHQPVRPARRRERQEGGPRAARQAVRRARLRPAFTDGAIEIRALGGDWLGVGDAPSPTALDALFDQLDPHQGYVAVMAYLDRLADAPLADGRVGAGARAPSGRRRSAGVRASCTRPASSTRAARPTGVYLQITTTPARGPRRSPAATSPSGTSSPPRPAATPRCSPTTAARCCGCT